MSDRIRVVGDIPMVYLRQRMEVPDEFNRDTGEEVTASKFALGNIGVGFEADLRPGLTAGLGFRLPTGPSPDWTREDADWDDLLLTIRALEVGYNADPSRYSAFMPQAASIYGTLRWRRALGEGPWEARLQATPSLTVSWGSQPMSTGDELVDFTELGTYISTAAHVFYTAEALHVGGGLVHTTFINFNDELWVYGRQNGLAFGAIAELDFGRYRPSVVAHLPIAGEDKKYVGATVGLGLTVVLE